MDINNITAVYFVGAGGIGMSALIRYFLSKGKKVGGYDKTPSGLTEQLNYEGAAIHYEDNVDLIPIRQRRWSSIPLPSQKTIRSSAISGGMVSR